jgi:hypothetical protein
MRLIFAVYVAVALQQALLQPRAAATGVVTDGTTDSRRFGRAQTSPRHRG